MPSEQVLGLMRIPKYTVPDFHQCPPPAADAVVISTFVWPDDHVLMEQAAHISHHNAIAAANARPVLQRPLLNRRGGIGPIPLESVKRGLGIFIPKTTSPPASVVLTNPTFDGLFLKPVKVVQNIHEVLRDYWQEHKQTHHFEQLFGYLRRERIGGDPQERLLDISRNEFIALGFELIVLLFYEAWSAKTYFHPRMIECTAIRAA
jgi:arginine/lysine/ornithine decarboxylase